jgi:hypothetical protein
MGLSGFPNNILPNNYYKLKDSILRIKDFIAELKIFIWITEETNI